MCSLKPDGTALAFIKSGRLEPARDTLCFASHSGGFTLVFLFGGRLPLQQATTFPSISLEIAYPFDDKLEAIYMGRSCTKETKIQRLFLKHQVKEPLDKCICDRATLKEC
jgi:hypothetical protein